MISFEKKIFKHGESCNTRRKQWTDIITGKILRATLYTILHHQMEKLREGEAFQHSWVSIWHVRERNGCRESRSALSPWFLRHQHEGHSGGRPWRCPLPREPRDVNHENPHSRRAARAPNPEGHQEPAHHVLAASTAELGSRCAALWHQRLGKQAKLNETAARLRRDIWTRRGAGAAGAAGPAWRRTSRGTGKAVLSGNSKSRARKGRSGRKEGNSDAGSQALRAREVEPRTPPSGRRADPVPRPGVCGLLGSVLNPRPEWLGVCQRIRD
nr:uncharacterized protein LOC105498432 [Macaca nemestrina]